MQPSNLFDSFNIRDFMTPRSRKIRVRKIEDLVRDFVSFIDGRLKSNRIMRIEQVICLTMGVTHLLGDGETSSKICLIFSLQR